jgi:ArsR family metal-binding transcriptional regulator
MKLCAEGSEHHARVEAAERAIQAHYSGQPPVPEQLKAAEELAMRAYWHPFQAAAIERLAGEYLDKYVRTRPTKRHEYVPMTICEKCGDHLPVGWLHACSGSGE